MIKVEHKEGLRSAYAELKFWEGKLSLEKNELSPKWYYVRCLKRGIRAYYRMQSQVPESRVMDYDPFDGYLEKVRVPSNCLTEEERENWFNSEVKRPMFPYVRGGYSSVWHSFLKLHGVWYVYHRTWLNV